MSLNILKTGGSLNVTKSDGSALNKVRIELSWNADGPRAPYDFDVTALEVDQNSGQAGVGKGIETGRVCFFNQKVTPAIVHSGDSQNGAGEGVDETIRIDLSKVDPRTNLIPILVTLFEANKRGQTFQQTNGAMCDLVNDETNEVLARVNLPDLKAGSTAAIISAFDKSSGSWKFVAVNEGFVGKEIGDFFKIYGF